MRRPAAPFTTLVNILVSTLCRTLFSTLAAVLTAGVLLLVGMPGGTADAATSSAEHAVHHRPSLQVEVSHRTVMAGSRDQLVTVRLAPDATGRVAFVLTSNDLRLVHRIKVRDGRAAYRPRGLGTGRYQLKVAYGGRTFESTFLVLDSQVVLDRSTFTLPAHRRSDDLDTLSGRVVLHGKRVHSGYVDLYRNGDRSGGESSRAFLGFAAIKPDGTFEYGSFGYDVHRRYAPGVYTFRAFYTPNPSYADYVSSNVITVRVE